LRDIFWALKGVAFHPSCFIIRRKALQRTLFPTEEAVPWIIRHLPFMQYFLQFGDQTGIFIFCSHSEPPEIARKAEGGTGSYEDAAGPQPYGCGRHVPAEVRQQEIAPGRVYFSAELTELMAETFPSDSVPLRVPGDFILMILKACRDFRGERVHRPGEHPPLKPLNGFRDRTQVSDADPRDAEDF
jgi:hypothetical protein